ncbi:hypothetical protein D3C75_1155180 [compost metagenome]
MFSPSASREVAIYSTLQAASIAGTISSGRLSKSSIILVIMAYNARVSISSKARRMS